MVMEAPTSMATATSTATTTAPAPTTAPAVAKTAPKRDFLEARQVSLYQLFDSSDFKFDIPPYQRPYAWRTKQVYELLQDFLRAYDARQEYFLGAIVATRVEDGTHVPYQLIDGQQRLTSLVLLLSLLHDCAGRVGNEGLQARLRRMLYLEADPLEPESSGRYRLRLRDSDDAFFRTNLLDAFLPTTYRLAGLAAAAEAQAQAAQPQDGAPVGAAEVDSSGEEGGSGAEPLTNETWWRLYENAAFMREQLERRVAEGLNLQDFTFHVLRNCFVVLMVARDEGASFRIFSSLNGRGMDLSVVDKLKADLLAGDLTPAERHHYAEAWAEMESVLGRSAFHRVFDHMRCLAAVRDPWVTELPLLDYFTRKVDDPRAVKQILQVALDYGRLLLQLRQASWAAPQLAALLAETPVEVTPAAEAVTAPAEVATEDRPEPAEAAEMAAEARAAVEAAAAAVLQRTELALTPAAEANDAVAAAVAAAAAAPDAAAEAAHLQRIEAEYRSWRWSAEAPSEASEVQDDAAVAEAAVAAQAFADNAAAEAATITEAESPVEGTPTEAAAAAEAEQAAVALLAVEPASDAAAAVPLLAADAPAEDFAPSDAATIVAEPEAEAEALTAGDVEAPAALTAASVAAAAAAACADADEASLLAELDFRSRLLNLFVDDAPLPPLLEFFYQTDDLRQRVAFMKGAEALQLHLELCGDPAAKAARWAAVSSALLARPFSPQAVLAALALSPEEKAAFRARLDAKDLYGTADQRTLRHLLLRCEPPSVVASLPGIASLHVEKMAPQNAPEGSSWRKTRIASPCDPQAPWPEPWFAATSATAASAPSAAASSGIVAAQPPEASPSHNAEAAVQPQDTAMHAVQQYDVKYWYEVQRLHWHGKLGNLVLLPAAAASGAAAATADYDARAALWRAAGVGSRLPGFTGPLLQERGRYGRFKFCYDECRQRHTDMLEYLAAEFEL
ncbi:hypothetical protein GPECTOR_4g600 [Gonium pectorale]|uniref:GmrSD restriction endonucleases N-terminal domain-containing protein n=1 Tax=Gonium pectorale TaxID=33097 RepID=A0A150GXJ9_GONPE|nr:hypothetical protein GPECTOR_4g600 [Gonium pectorale]|eukprot:KXZ54535.1 hypothetical protein GPECTOR_4g600 [Gonium pectorale]